MDTTVLTVEDLSINFVTKFGRANAVDNVSFALKKGERLGIVGESGSGKSVICKAMLQLLPEYAEVDGKVMHDGKNILTLTNRQMYDIRGREISMIFQEPMTSLNPLFTIGNQLVETIMLHQKISKQDAREHAVQMLRQVSIHQPDERLGQYPFELSGGMRQRVMIAMALSSDPGVLIADEPTTALDVTTQAQILELTRKLNAELSTALILITHDLGVIAETVERVIVMYAGQMVESADVRSIFHNTLHPYTKGLLNAIPKVEVKRQALEAIPGTVPNIFDMPEGCRFHTRCRHKKNICTQKSPPVSTAEDDHRVKCWMYTEEWK